MAGRSRLPPYVLHHEDRPSPPHLRHHHLPHFSHHHHHHHQHPASVVVVLEDRLAAQHRETQNLLLDNQHLAATHVALKQELTSSRLNLRVAADSVARTKADGDAKVRKVYERCMKVEDEARAVDGMRMELVQVRSDVSKLGKLRDELLERLKEFKDELGRVRGKMGRSEEIKENFEMMRKELERGRLAVEYEKKVHADNLEQSKAMEKNMLSLAREVENLRAELANTEKRARAAAAAAANPGQGYAETYGNSEMAYGGSSYTDAYSLHQVGINSGSQYEFPAAPHSFYDIQQSHAH
ncbi:putative protein FLX-like 1 [Iris pallida]|uniref:Protein FLC EXPRESSOR n=1 Tax=Iris pallida TaxID=29817 RepID=A0AAX6FVC9_IRIPA|nr:putative protein FLX-like 1 [Iris pallida]